MRSAILEKWKELVIEAVPQLNTKEELVGLYKNIPDSIVPAFVDKLAERAISLESA
jgi:hypothetical protein